MMGEDNRMEATLSLREDGGAEVALSLRGSGARVGVHVFGTLDEALAWLDAMKWDYKVAA